MTPAQAWRVIIIDDSVDDRAEIRRLLFKGSDRRYHFAEAETGVVGVGTVLDATNSLPDCVVLDYNLPDMDAVEVLTALTDGDGVSVCPVVVLTGSGGYEQTRMVLRAGAQDYLSKAWMTPESLTRAVENAVERWAMARELHDREMKLRRSAERDTFRFALGEALRPLADPTAIKVKAAHMLGQHLQASRVSYAETEPTGGLILEPGYTDGVADITGWYHLDDYGSELLSTIEMGRNVVVADVPNHPEFSDLEKARYEAIQVVAHLNVPLMKDGVTVAILAVHQSTPRQWSSDEVALVEETAERTWSSVGRARTEVAMREGEEHLRMALTAARAGAWSWEMATGLVTWSPENYTLYGIDPADGLPTYAKWEAQIYPNDRAQTNAAVQDTLNGRSPQFRSEFRVVHPTQGICWLLGLGRVEFDLAGEPVRMIGINLDITDRKLFEQTLAEQDQRKDEFLATLAHELRNPLAPIRNGLQFLHLAPHGDAAVKTREMMERQLGHMVRLIDDLLDVSRINSGKIELKREPVQLQVVFSQGIEASRSLIDAAGHELTITLPDEPMWLDGDLTRLAQIVTNLVNNSAKYTPNGGQISLSAEIQENNTIIRVIDNGTGIAAEMLPGVFDMFSQVDRTLGRSQGGLGIGLSLVKKLVQMHGGSIHAESPGMGFGSTFTVQLPLMTHTASRDQSLLPHTEFPIARDRTSLRVLVVDDNADGAISLGMLLKMMGHTSRTASNGLEAIETSAEFRPDLVFLDIGLPGIDGFEVCRRLRTNPDLSGTTFVALTGWGTENDKKLTKDAGFMAHLVKPVVLDHIDALLKKAVADRK